MTGRDLIIYILQNNLEDESVFKSGKFIGFIPAHEAAAKLGVGVATIYVYVDQGRLDGTFLRAYQEPTMLYILDDPIKFEALAKELKERQE